MNNKQKQVLVLTATIVQKMIMIERHQGGVFREINPELEKEIVEAVDSQNLSKLHATVEKMDELLQDRH